MNVRNDYMSIWQVNDKCFRMYNNINYNYKLKLVFIYKLTFM